MQSRPREAPPSNTTIRPAGDNLRYSAHNPQLHPMGRRWTVYKGDKLSTRKGRAFREAWITGVMQHYPGEPKPSYISPRDETPEWERESAAAVYDQVRAFIETTDGGTAKLT